MKKKLLAVAMGAMLAAGAANAVTVNHAGLGDLLVSPAYSIGGGSQSSPVASLEAMTTVRDDAGQVLGSITIVPSDDAWKLALAAQVHAEPRYKIRIERGPQRQRMQT